MSRELTRRAFLGDAALVGVASMIGLENVLAGEVPPAANPPLARRLFPSQRSTANQAFVLQS